MQAAAQSTHATSLAGGHTPLSHTPPANAQSPSPEQAPQACVARHTWPFVHSVELVHWRQIPSMQCGVPGVVLQSGSRMQCIGGGPSVPPSFETTAHVCCVLSQL